MAENKKFKQISICSANNQSETFEMLFFFLDIICSFSQHAIPFDSILFFTYRFLNVIIVSNCSNILFPRWRKQSIHIYSLFCSSGYILNICIYKKEAESGYLSVFFFLFPVARCYGDLYYPIWYIRMYIFSGKAKAGKRRKKTILVHLDIVKKILRLLFFLRTISAEETYTYISSYIILNRRFKE